MTDQPQSPALDPQVQPVSPLLILLTSRIGLLLLAYLGLALFPAGQNPGNAFPGNHFLDGWTRWDAGWYAHIASNGYTNQSVDESGQRDTVCMPLYPLAIRALTMLTGNEYSSGLIISNVSFVLAGLLLYQLVLARWGTEIARRTLVLLCVYPFSYTFTAMYTESLFLLLALGAFWFGERKLWLPAALCAAGAGATRVVGVACAAALFVMYLQSVEWKLREVRRNALWLALSFAGLGAFIMFLWLRFDEPLAFIAVHSAHGWGDFNSWESVRETLRIWRNAGFGGIASGNVPLILGLHLLLVVVAMVLCALSWWKLPPAYATFATLVVFISAYRWGCFGRHFSTAFPAFIVAAMLLRDRRLYHGVVYLSTLLLALLTLLFTHSFWVA